MLNNRINGDLGKPPTFQSSDPIVTRPVTVRQGAAVVQLESGLEAYFEADLPQTPGV